jgi:hypothetical protein
MLFETRELKIAWRQYGNCQVGATFTSLAYTVIGTTLGGGKISDAADYMVITHSSRTELRRFTGPLSFLQARWTMFYISFFLIYLCRNTF